MTLDGRRIKDLFDRLEQSQANLEALDTSASRQFLDSLERLAISFLEIWELAQAQAATKLSREDLESALSALRAWKAKLSGVEVDPETDYEPSLFELLCAVRDVTDVAMSFVASNSRMLRQAAKARAARSNSPKEIALQAIIESLRGTGPCPHPSKEAESICEKVNEGLDLMKRGPVSVHAIYRRLVKFSRS